LEIEDIHKQAVIPGRAAEPGIQSSDVANSSLNEKGRRSGFRVPLRGPGMMGWTALFYGIEYAKTGSLR
jgi:hypothetical protein